MTGSTPGPSRIEWVRGGCRLLGSIAAEFARTRPFEGLTIGTGIHLEPKTVALLLTLAQGGARVVSTGNLSSTQADAAGYLRARGVEVIGAATTDQGVHDGYLRQVIATRPHLLLDNGSATSLRAVPGRGRTRGCWAAPRRRPRCRMRLRCLEAVAARSVGAGHEVVPVPRFIDELVATSFLDRYGRSGLPRPGQACRVTPQPGSGRPGDGPPSPGQARGPGG